MTDLTPAQALAASAIIRVRATREDRPHWLPIADALAGWANRHAPTDRQDTRVAVDPAPTLSGAL